jgi:pilus assembly protein FimV
MEEDATARGKALREANERIALLEKNIKELQRLLELKNLALAEMQKRAEGIQTGPRELSADPEAIQRRLQPDHIAEGESETSPSLSSISAQANSPEETPATQTAGSEPVELAKPARSVNMTHEAGLSNAKANTRGKVSFFDDLMANFEYLGGALVLLLTGIVGVSMVRGSRSSSVFDFQDDNRAGAPAHQPQESADRSAVRSEANAAGSTDVPELAPDVKPDLPSISLTMADAPLGATAKPQLAEPEPERGAHWYEIVTKLDLARAYQEMGDKESARQILQEVVQEGNERQRKHASAVLKTL